MGYINPLLELPAAEALLDLPACDRGRFEAIFRELRDQANEQAENAWRRRKAPMAAYWRAVATYSRHVAHALRRGQPTVKPTNNTRAGKRPVRKASGSGRAS